ncbi:MAG: DNA polymerase III subunit delta [Muribaculaceae bacterium]|nr:DNA polymerase III subunit delta [Muribaculaceae bacterium]
MRFSDILGNEQAVKQVRHLIDADRLPHALLLYGEPGVPKLALARVMAQYLHCPHRHDGEPCGVCPSCRQHETMNHTDTFYSFPYWRKDKNSEACCDDFIERWREFLADCPVVEDYQHWLELLKNENSQPEILVRESANILRKMSMSSFTSKYKVSIIWLPEKLRDDAANKLLKLIEEPYDDCKFILVSDNAQGILGTIYSRTQRIELRRLSAPIVAQYLAQHYGMEAQDALAVAAPADGNINMALHSMRQDSELHEFHQVFVELMRLAYMRNLGKLRNWAERVADMKREKSRRFLSYCSRQVRENYIYNLHHPELNYLTREEQQFSSRFAPYINEANVERMSEQFRLAAQHIAGNGNSKIILFDMAVRITILIKV